MATLRLALIYLAIAACGESRTQLVPDAGPGSCPTGSCTGSAPSFSAGSLIIPMDLSYQSTGMFQAYGLIYQLLRQGVHVFWIIEPNKTWHSAPCNTPRLG